MTDSQMDLMRAQGHNIPLVVDLPRRSNLTAPECVRAIQRLFVLRNILAPQLRGMFPEDPPAGIWARLREELRNSEEDPLTGRAGMWFERYVRPYPELREFVAHSRSLGEDGVTEDQDFCHLYRLVLSVEMCRPALNCLVECLLLDAQESTGEVPPGTAAARRRKVVTEDFVTGPISEAMVEEASRWAP